MKRTLLLAFALMMIAAVVLFTTSCGKKAMQNTPETISQPEVPAKSDVSAQETEKDALPVEAPEPEVVETAFATEPIYFAFDSSVLPAHAPQILTGMADYLRGNPTLAVTVQGHCDERGSDAYNMALGKRRAESVKTFLVEQGISAARLYTISFGKTRPVALGQNEASWAKNRRAEMLIN